MSTPLSPWLLFIAFFVTVSLGTAFQPARVSVLSLCLVAMRTIFIVFVPARASKPSIHPLLVLFLEPPFPLTNVCSRAPFFTTPLAVLLVLLLCVPAGIIFIVYFLTNKQPVDGVRERQPWKITEGRTRESEEEARRTRVIITRNYAPRQGGYATAEVYVRDISRYFTFRQLTREAEARAPPPTTVGVAVFADKSLKRRHVSLRRSPTRTLPSSFFRPARFISPSLRRY